MIILPKAVSEVARKSGNFVLLHINNSNGKGCVGTGSNIDQLWPPIPLKAFKVQIKRTLLAPLPAHTHSLSIFVARFQVPNPSAVNLEMRQREYPPPMTTYPEPCMYFHTPCEIDAQTQEVAWHALSILCAALSEWERKELMGGRHRQTAPASGWLANIHRPGGISARHTSYCSYKPVGKATAVRLSGWLVGYLTDQSYGVVYIRNTRQHPTGRLNVLFCSSAYIIIIIMNETGNSCIT